MNLLSLQNGFLSSLPYLGAWLFSTLSGVVADSLVERRVFSVTAVRKIFTVVGKKRLSLRLTLRRLISRRASRLLEPHRAAPPKLCSPRTPQSLNIYTRRSASHKPVFGLLCINGSMLYTQTVTGPICD